MPLNVRYGALSHTYLCVSIYFKLEFIYVNYIYIHTYIYRYRHIHIQKKEYAIA